MIVFQVSLNLNPVKEILKIPMSDLYLNESDCSEENTMKNFTLLFFNHFSVSLNKTYSRLY